jgi:hypothetical protein
MINMKNIYRKIIMMMVVLALLVVMSAPTAMAVSGKLWLEPVPAGTYVNSSEDAWLEDSWVTTDTSFDLQIHNHNADDIYSLYLLVAVDRVPTDNVTVSVNGSVVSTYDGVITTNNNALVPETDPDYEYPGHGVYKYGSDTHFEVVAVTIPDDGILGKGENMSVPIEITPLVSTVKVHFDAVGANATNKAIAFAPPSHDVTYAIPEFATIAIPAIAILGLFAFYRRKQKK